METQDGRPKPAEFVTEFEATGKILTTLYKQDIGVHYLIAVEKIERPKEFARVFHDVNPYVFIVSLSKGLDTRIDTDFRDVSVTPSIMYSMVPASVRNKENIISSIIQGRADNLILGLSVEEF